MVIGSLKLILLRYRSLPTVNTDDIISIEVDVEIPKATVYKIKYPKEVVSALFCKA